MPGWQKVDGKRLRELRLERMISQAELAQKAGVTQAAISVYEHGGRQLQPRSVRKLADALDVEPRELLP